MGRFCQVLLPSALFIGASACSDGPVVVSLPPIEDAQSIIIGVESNTGLDVYAHPADQLPIPFMFSGVKRVQVLRYDDRSLDDLGLRSGLVAPAAPGEASRSLEPSDGVFEWTPEGEDWRSAELSSALQSFRLPALARDCVQLVDLELIELDKVDQTSTAYPIAIDDYRAIVLNAGTWFLYSGLDHSVTELQLEPAELAPHRARMSQAGTIIGAVGYSLISAELDLPGLRVQLSPIVTSSATGPGFSDIMFSSADDFFAGDALGRLFRLNSSGLDLIYDGAWPEGQTAFLDDITSGEVAFASPQRLSMVFAGHKGPEINEVPGNAGPTALTEGEATRRVLANVDGELFAYRAPSWGRIGETPDRTRVRTLLSHEPRRFLMGGEFGLVGLFDDGRACTITRALDLHVNQLIRLGDRFIATGSRVSDARVGAFAVFGLQP